MTDSMKFGPEWLRNMSADGGSTFNVNGPPRYPLAEFRYGREEMLSLFEKKNLKVPEILPKFKKLYTDKAKCPLALRPNTEDDTYVWTRTLDITNVSSRGARGGSVDRGRGRGRGTFHPSIGSYQRSTSLYDDDGRIISSTSGRNSVGGGNSNNSSTISGDPVENWHSSSSISSPRKEYASHGRSTNMENWRRNRIEEDNGTGIGGASDGWRSSINNRNSEKWNRSISWRDEDGQQPTYDGTNLSRSDKSNSNKVYGNDDKINSYNDDDLPEWATEDSHEGGGSFDSTGAFHGSSEDLEDKLKQQNSLNTNNSSKTDDGANRIDDSKSNDDSKINTTYSIQIDPIPRIHYMDGKWPGDHSFDQCLPNYVPNSDKTNIIEPEDMHLEKPTSQHQLTNNPSQIKMNFCKDMISVDRMQEVADDMVEKLIMDDEINHITSTTGGGSNVGSASDILINKNTTSLNSKSLNLTVSPNLIQQQLMKNINDDNLMVVNVDGNVIIPSNQSKPPPMPLTMLSNVIQTSTVVPPPSGPSSDLWFYHDPQGNIQGPFTATEMAEWYRAGYFDENLYLRRHCDSRFSTLGDLVEMCGGAIPFLASHLLPPVGHNNNTSILLTCKPDIPTQLHHQISHPPPQSQPPPQQQSTQQQQQSQSTIPNSNKTTNMLELNYLIQKQYLLKQQQQQQQQSIVAQKLSSMVEPWGRLSVDQQNQLVSQQMAHIASTGVPNYPENIQRQQIIQQINKLNQIPHPTQPPMGAPQTTQNQTKPLINKPQLQPPNHHFQYNPNEQLQQFILPQQQVPQQQPTLQQDLIENDPIKSLIMQLSMQKNGANGTSQPNQTIDIQNLNQQNPQSPWIGGNSNVNNLVNLQNSNLMIKPQQKPHGGALNQKPVQQQPPSSLQKPASNQPSWNISIWDRLPETNTTQLTSNQNVLHTNNDLIENSENSQQSNLKQLPQLLQQQPSAKLKDHDSQLPASNNNIPAKINDNKKENKTEAKQKKENTDKSTTKKEKPITTTVINKKEKIKSNIIAGDDFIVEMKKGTKKLLRNQEEKKNENKSNKTDVQTQPPPPPPPQQRIQRNTTNAGQSSINNNSNAYSNGSSSNNITTNSASSVAPWSSTGLHGLQSPSLAEIQKSEMERRAEQYRIEQLLREQQQQQQAMLEMQLTKHNTFIWNGRNNILPKNIKSLAEIQAEEHAKQQQAQLEQLNSSINNTNKQNVSNININKSSKQSDDGKTFSSLWNTSSNINWASINNQTTSSQQFNYTNTINNSNNNNKVAWGNNANSSNLTLNMITQAGFWEEPIKVNKNDQSNSNSKILLSKSQTLSNIQTTKSNKASNNNSSKTTSVSPSSITMNKQNNAAIPRIAKLSVNAGNKKDKGDKKDNQSSIINPGGNCSNSNEFINWCIKTLSSITNTVDVPTFATFLQDIESPYEVKDYIKGYLGESRECSDFAKQFLERRSKYKNQQRAQNAHIDDMCSPAPAINPGTNEFQEVKGKGKKIKKGKMMKLDSRILGFSVTAAQDRLNIGDRDYGDAS